MSFKDKIDISRLPKHIAIIMDGNGRWAQQRGEFRVFGHENGVKSVREVSEACSELGIQYLTLYAFSTENWNRPKFEVTALMELLVKTIHAELKTLNDNNIRLQAIGDLDSLEVNCRNELLEAITNTAHNTGLNLVLALSYSSRWEITNATKKLAADIQSGNILPNEITQERFEKYLTTSQMPDPELLIRTSGEFRISNFLLWQIAYAELYFSPILWPDFRKENLFEAIVDFQNRERRFGMTSEQLNTKPNR